MSGVNIRAFEPKDTHQILELFVHVFGVRQAESFWRWQYESNVAGPGCITVAEVENRIVGQVALRRNRINFLGENLDAVQSCDTMIDPAYRGTSLFVDIIKKSTNLAADMGISAVFGFPNRLAYPALMRFGGRFHIATLKCYVYRLGYRKFIGKYLDQAVRSLVGLRNLGSFSVRKKMMRDPIRIDVQTSIPEDVDALIEESRRYQILSIWKNSDYLEWRYVRHPLYRYEFHALKVRGRLEAVAVCRDCRDKVEICEFIHKTRHLRQSVLFLKKIIRYYTFRCAETIEFKGWDDGFFDYIFKAAGFSGFPCTSLVFVGRAFSPVRLEKMWTNPLNWTVVMGDADFI